ncbi:MAG: hypothetical protein KDD19_10585 [Phaeodactylibacter sp.]|nr:hypothetical protein [Phaeodactylibacter sp.]
MPIKIKNAPKRSLDELKNIIPSFRNEAINIYEEQDHSHFVPHKIYDPSVFDLAAGKGLANTQQTGWRYLFQDEKGEYHVAEIGMDEELDEHKFHHVNLGGHVNSFVAIYDRLHNHEHVEEKHYEINILRISPIYVMAIWLKGEDHEHEFFIPLAPVNSKFEAGRTYEYDEFMPLLQEAAQEVVSFEEEHASATDDLTRIEGIGPKAATILNEAGYTTFSSVAAAQPAVMEAVLKAAGSRYNFLDATTWPEQAALAAEGRWEELDKLQDELKGGRRE